MRNPSNVTPTFTTAPARSQRGLTFENNRRIMSASGSELRRDEMNCRRMAGIGRTRRPEILAILLFASGHFVRRIVGRTYLCLVSRKGHYYDRQQPKTFPGMARTGGPQASRRTRDAPESLPQPHIAASSDRPAVKQAARARDAADDPTNRR